jgi:hypothetical protein
MTVIKAQIRVVRNEALVPYPLFDDPTPVPVLGTRL